MNSKPESTSRPAPLPRSNGWRYDSYFREQLEKVKEVSNAAGAQIAELYPLQSPPNSAQLEVSE